MIDYSIIDLTNQDHLKILIREFFNMLNNVQWLLFILVILLGVLFGVFIIKFLFGGKLK